MSDIDAVDYGESREIRLSMTAENIQIPNADASGDKEEGDEE